MTTTASTTASPIQLPLTLRPRRGELLRDQVDALLIPAADARTWLDEVCRWGIPTESLRLMIVPRSRSDRRAAGALVILPPNNSGRIDASTLAEPYVQVAPSLYIPASSILHPPMSDSELAQILRLEMNLMHPSIGLIGCASSELLRVSDLLVAPQPAPIEWGLAVPGVAAEANIRSVRPGWVPSVEEFFQQSRDDIGSDNPKDLPRLPGESFINKLTSNAMIGGLSAMQWVAGLAGGALGAAGGGGAMSKWASDKLAALRKNLDDARSKELARLMNLLQDNPDEGLRYALPLNAPGSGRGIATPGSRLGRRDINFSLGGLFSSSASDPWQLSWEMHQQLMNKYRELATRELALGRYRRAAYIFGQLLRDYHGAANALKQGRFFREAAVLYRDQLHDKKSAAECLEEGGLLIEAIEIYESLKQYETVGDLYRKLDRSEDAERAFRRAVDELRERKDTLRAARLLESKLAVADESLELLTGAWPDASQAAACLEESFALLGRLARHDESIRRLAHFRDHPPPANRALSLADVLANVATSHPSFEVRAAAADATRVVVGNRLPAAPSSEAFCLVNAAVRVASDDRLLVRDGQRFVDRISKPVIARKPDRARPREIPGKAKPPVLVRTFRLGGDTHWMTATSTGSTFYAQGVRDDEVILMRGTWDGTMQQISWPDPMAPESQYRLRVAGDDHVMIIPAGGYDRRLTRKRFGKHDAFRGGEVFAGTPYFFPPGAIYDACVDEASTVWVLHANENDSYLLLSGFSLVGGALRSSGLTPLPIPDAAAVSSTHLIVRAGHACITAGSEVWVQHSEKWRKIDLRSSIVGVTSSPPHTRLRLAISFPEGACLFWPDGFELKRVAQQLVDPMCCILRDGTLVTAGRRQAMLYSITGHDVLHLSTVEADPTPPIAVMAAQDSNHFATLGSDGLLRIFGRG